MYRIVGDIEKFVGNKLHPSLIERRATRVGICHPEGWTSKLPEVTRFDTYIEVVSCLELIQERRIYYCGQERVQDIRIQYLESGIFWDDVA